MKVSLRLRVTAVVTAAVAVCTTALAFTAYGITSSNSQSRFVQTSLRTARADFDEAAQAARQVPPTQQVTAVRDYVSRRGLPWRLTFPHHFAGDGCIDDRFPRRLDEVYRPGPLQHAWIRLCSDHHTLAVYGAPVTGVSVAEFFDYQPVIDQLAHLRNVLLWLGGIALVLALLVGLFVGRFVARPVTRAARAARQFAEDLSVRLPSVQLRGAPEFVELGTAFNDMADRVQTASDQQRRFVSDVAHELRTPLAAMLAAADGVNSDDAVRRRRCKELLVAQTSRLAHMVDDLLEISRFDAGRAELTPEDIDLAALVADAAQAVASDNPVEITTIGDITADVDAPRIHTIIRNLIANAVQHGAAPIEILIDGHEADVTVTVSDGGAGIPADLANIVFDRYVRGDTSRSTGQKPGTTGLGLAIARENANLHGGTLALSSHQPTRFTLTLPRRHHDADASTT